MIVLYRKGGTEWVQTGRLLPNELQVAVAVDSEPRFGCFSQNEALEIVRQEIAKRGNEIYRIEIGPASESAKRKGRSHGPPIERA